MSNFNRSQIMKIFLSFGQWPMITVLCNLILEFGMIENFIISPNHVIKMNVYTTDTCVYVYTLYISLYMKGPNLRP